MRKKEGEKLKIVIKNFAFLLIIFILYIRFDTCYIIYFLA